MKQELVLPVIENGKIKYLKQVKERKSKINEELVLPVIEDGKLKYLKQKQKVHKSVLF